MGLSVEEIKKEIREPKKRAELGRAVYHQNRVRFHAQMAVTPYVAQPVTDFLAFVQNLIPHDKFQIFKALFRFPLKTNEVAGVCFDKLSRVFDGRNPAYNYQFMSGEARDDWEWYRMEVLKEPEIWSTKGWEYFKTEINSVLIVDLPSEQPDGDRYPAPYFYWLTIDNVITYAVDQKSGNMAWIIFQQEGERIAVIDNERYRVFRAEKGGGIGELLIDAEHSLGYCPARFFWDDPLNLKDPDIKVSPLTKELEALDWYLFYHISKRHLDLYGSYPIYSGYEQSCDYSNGETGDTCDGGYLKDRQGYYKLDSAGMLMRCPKCGDKRIAGVGSFVEVPIPNGADQPDLRNPVQMLTVDRSSLDYNVAEEERLRNNIITAVVGTAEDVTQKEAINEQQVRANFESQSTVLGRIKRGFEIARQFIDDTVCRLRYGDEYISSKISLGTEFYIFDAAELRQRYQMAKTSGASEAELDALQNQIIESEYRNNPTQLQRLLTLADIEPYRHLTRAEVLDLYNRGLVSDVDLHVKLDFAAMVRRFERENINVLEFGTAIPYNRKIEIIQSKLREYASENKQRTEGRKPAGGDE